MPYVEVIGLDSLEALGGAVRDPAIDNGGDRCPLGWGTRVKEVLSRPVRQVFEQGSAAGLEEQVRVLVYNQIGQLGLGQ
jgi:hypothetical protein